MGKIVKIKKFVEKHERYLSGVALLTGFTVDNLTLTRIDLWFDNLILFSYLTLAGGTILLINSARKTLWFQRWLPYVMQYAFGGLFSGFVIFYSRSASLASSWLFLLVLVVLLVGNEFFKKKYERLTFHVGVYFVALFSFFIFFVPVITGKMGPWIFILSGVASLIAIGFVVHALIFFTKGSVKKYRKNIIVTVVATFVVFNILYFTNIIPPIPLSLKDVGIYYNVEKTAGYNYIVSYEDIPWYQFYKRDEFKYIPGSRLYSFSSVFAPTRIKSTIIHEWSYLDESKREWIVSSSIPFAISGGRDGGFRGFTYKESLVPGKWRVEVKTQRGQLLGRINFKILHSDARPPVKREVK